MRKIVLLLWIASLCVCGFAQGVVEALPKNFDPLQVQRQFDHDSMLKSLKKNGTTKAASERQSLTKRKATVSKSLRRADGQTVDTVQYFAATQTYLKNYVFNYNGGDIKTYNVGIAVDGTKVTFKNMFNLYDPTITWYTNTEYDIEGTYDPTAKTITVPTSSTFANATVVGEIGGYYTAILVSGTVDENGKMAPDANLVFNVIGDFEAITTDQSIAVAEYTKDGSQSYGMYKTYRKFYAALPTSSAKLITFNNNFEFGETFPNTPVTQVATLINMGTTDADYAISLESDDESFTSTPVGGTVAGLGTSEVTYTFSAANVGEYEGIATIDYESDGDAEPILMQMSGTVKAFPDYSGAVKSGDFDISTNIEYPFEMVTLSDGTQVAQSGTHSAGGASSKLTVAFTVPEGNIGKFSWKGKSFNTGYWYSNAAGYFIDDSGTSEVAWTDAETDISRTLEFAPGKHSVRFQYDGYYVGTEEDRMYVYGLCLENTPAESDAAEVKSSSIDFGSFIVENNTQEGTATIDIVNRGTNPLQVTYVESDNEAFTLTKPTTTVGLLETLNVPVTFRTDKAGEYTGKLTVETTGGTFEVTAKATVRERPDFASIVTEGADLMTFSTDPANPFVVEDGVAYNASSMQPDYTANTAWFQVDFNIPSGKVGYISWDGHSYGKPGAYYDYASDYSIFDVQHPMTSGYLQAWGDTDACSDSVFADESWKPLLTCVPGAHHVKFGYYQCGDSVGYGKDRLEVSNLKLHLIDFNEYGAELLDTSAEFDSVYVGPQRYSTAKVTLHNTGSKALQVTEVTGDAPFYGIVPTDSAQFDKDMEVELWFYPSEPGTFTGNVTIKTNAGDYVVSCTGTAKSSEGILLNGDIEDQGYNWSAYDMDGDGENWNLGYNLFGGYYPEWCHGGNDCMGSASYSWYNGDIQPDNWLFSPTVTIPDEGATLRWYAATHNTKKPKEHYSVYVEESDAYADASNLKTLTPVFSETLDTVAARTWQEHTIDLKPYAGKTIAVAFRHHDCKGQYVLKLDDIMVYTNDYSAAINSTPKADAKVTRQEIYNMKGVKTSSLSRGINLIRKYYDDGTVKTTKILRK